MIYFCEDCKTYFDDADRACYKEDVEWHSELGSECEHYPERIVLKVCPNCGSEEYEEASACPLCGAFYHTSDTICPECQSKIKNAVDELTQDLSFNGHGEFKENKDIVVTWIAENL